MVQFGWNLVGRSNVWLEIRLAHPTTPITNFRPLQPPQTTLPPPIPMLLRLFDSVITGVKVISTLTISSPAPFLHLHCFSCIRTTAPKQWCMYFFILRWILFLRRSLRCAPNSRGSTASWSIFYPRCWEKKGATSTRKPSVSLTQSTFYDWLWY